MSDLILPKHLEFKDEAVKVKVTLKVKLLYRDPPLAKQEEMRRNIIQKAMDKEAIDMEETIKNMVENKLGLTKPS
jgi:hypothetical protein